MLGGSETETEPRREREKESECVYVCVPVLAGVREYARAPHTVSHGTHRLTVSFCMLINSHIMCAVPFSVHIRGCRFVTHRNGVFGFKNDFDE